MSLVNVTNVVVLDNPSYFDNPFQFEITFECLQDLAEDLEWKVIYVGSSESSEYDQTLEEVLVGPVTAGCHKFVLQADAPDPATLPELLGVTVVLIACSYQNHEFVRIGYYVNNEHEDEQHQEQQQQEQQQRQLQQQPFQNLHGSDSDNDDMEILMTTPTTTTMDMHDVSKIIRTTLADKPRVTRFAIPWHTLPQQQQEQLQEYHDVESIVMTTATMMTTTSPDSRMDNAIQARIVSPTNDMEL
ncbi:Histone chaperone [Fragilaria crotonensis]|nr:Histone chaperone [Fragilaria crotonensis]